MNNWKPNEKQNAFLKVLGEQAKPMTLAELSEVAGTEFKTGTTNTLVSKGLVATEDTTLECDIVLHGTNKVVGHTKKTVKLYSLVQKD